MNFETWMDEVNGHIEDTCGMTADDLPDCPYYDWYEDDVSAPRAARMAMRLAQ